MSRASYLVGFGSMRSLLVDSDVLVLMGAFIQVVTKEYKVTITANYARKSYGSCRNPEKQAMTSAAAPRPRHPEAPIAGRWRLPQICWCRAQRALVDLVRAWLWIVENFCQMEANASDKVNETNEWNAKLMGSSIYDSISVGCSESNKSRWS